MNAEYYFKKYKYPNTCKKFILRLGGFMKKTCRIIARIMLVVAIGFIAFALNHPESNFHWSNAVTYIIYVIYALVMIVLFIEPFKCKNK